MRVRVSELIDPLSGGEFDEPQWGNRLVGVQLQLENVGDGTYSDSPSNGAKVLTNKDEQADPALLTGGECGGSFASDLTISPGSKRRGCIPFEVPEAQRATTFQFSLDSGFGPQSGEWKVALRRHGERTDSRRPFDCFGQGAAELWP